MTITVKRHQLDRRIAQHGPDYAADLLPAVISESPESLTIDPAHPAFAVVAAKYRREARNASARPSFGPGTELARLLRRFGIQQGDDCRCRWRIAQMDKRGTAWCNDNEAVIVGWLREAARARSLPFWEFGVRVLIRRAVRLAERSGRRPTSNAV